MKGLFGIDPLTGRVISGEWDFDGHDFTPTDPGRAYRARREEATPAPAALRLRISETHARLDAEALYHAYAQTVARWAARLAGPAHDVEDLVQEVFLQVKRKLPGFRGDSQITTWLYAITYNVVRDERRRQRWRRWWLGGSADEVAGSLPCGELTPQEALERRQAQQLVYQVLETLNERYRTVLILHEIEGLSGEEIAELLDAKLPTVWVWLHRARQKFADRLETLARRGGRCPGGKR